MLAGDTRAIFGAAAAFSDDAIELLAASTANANPTQPSPRSTGLARCPATTACWVHKKGPSAGPSLDPLESPGEQLWQTRPRWHLGADADSKRHSWGLRPLDETTRWNTHLQGSVPNAATSERLCVACFPCKSAKADARIRTADPFITS
jgi:hypothetical protein